MDGRYSPGETFCAGAIGGSAGVVLTGSGPGGVAIGGSDGGTTVCTSRISVGGRIFGPALPSARKVPAATQLGSRSSGGGIAAVSVFEGASAGGVFEVNASAAFSVGMGVIPPDGSSTIVGALAGGEGIGGGTAGASDAGGAAGGTARATAVE